MGHVRLNIKVKRRSCWTMFDTGSRNTYVNRDVAKLLPTFNAPEPRKVGLGGAVRTITRTAILKAKVDGHTVDTNAWVVDDIGKDEEGKPIEILFGALAMQQWGIRPIPDEERLDLTHYPAAFVEY